jgi:hypothetical protein
MRIDEATNLHGKKVRVRVWGCYNDRNRVTDDYYLFYDEAEVYHIEDKRTQKIVYTFGCNSWTKAIEKSLKYLEANK